mgnify:CR=1 FL=1
MRKRVLQWVQVVIGIYSFIYVPIEFLLLTHSHSADLPVLNYLPEFFIGYGVASADIYIFVGLLFMAFIFFCMSFASAIWQRVRTRLCCGELILKYLSPVM